MTSKFKQISRSDFQ